MSERRGSYLEALLIGGALGAVVALLIATQKGEDTRNQIKTKWEELTHKGTDVLDGAREETGEILHQGMELLEIGLDRLSVAIEEGRKATENKRQELNQNGHRS